MTDFTALSPGNLKQPDMSSIGFCDDGLRYVENLRQRRRQSRLRQQANASPTPTITDHSLKGRQGPGSSFHILGGLRRKLTVTLTNVKLHDTNTSPLLSSRTSASDHLRSPTPSSSPSRKLALGFESPQTTFGRGGFLRKLSMRRSPRISALAQDSSIEARPVTSPVPNSPTHVARHDLPQLSEEMTLETPAPESPLWPPVPERISSRGAVDSGRRNSDVNYTDTTALWRGPGELVLTKSGQTDGDSELASPLGEGGGNTVETGLAVIGQVVRRNTVRVIGTPRRVQAPRTQHVAQEVEAGAN